MKQYYAIMLITSAIATYANEDKSRPDKPLPLTLTLDELSNLLHRSDDKAPEQKNATRRLSSRKIKNYMNTLAIIAAKEPLHKQESDKEPLSDTEKELCQLRAVNRERAEWLLELCASLYMDKVEEKMKVESIITKNAKSQDLTL